MKKTPKNIPSPYKFPGTPIFRDTTALPFADGGPLNDKTNHGKILNSVYASALGNYYKDGGQFQGKYSLPEDSFRQGGKNLHDSIYASSPQQYPGIYNLGGNLDDRQQMYMPLDHVTRNGGSILSMSNTPQMEGEGKDLTYPENSYAYDGGGSLYTFAGRPGAKYQKDNQGNWLINTNNGTEFIPINDPTGKRSAILNKQATVYINPNNFKREYNSLLDTPTLTRDNTKVQIANKAVPVADMHLKTEKEKSDERLAAMWAEGNKQRDAQNPAIDPQTGKYRSMSAGEADWVWSLPTAGSAGLKAAGAIGGMALPGMASVPGATVGNLVNSGFIANSLYNTPKNAEEWYDVSQGKKDWTEAAAGTAEIAAGLVGSGAGAKAALQEAEKLGLKNVITGKAPIKDLFKRDDLVNIKTTEDLAKFRAAQTEGRLGETTNRFYSSTSNPDVLNYAKGEGEVFVHAMPQTKAAAAGKSLANIKPEGAALIARQRSIPTSAAVEEIIASGKLSGQSEETLQGLREIAANPEGYWNLNSFKNNKELQSLVESPTLVNPAEYFLPRPAAGDFKLMSIGSLATSKPKLIDTQKITDKALTGLQEEGIGTHVTKHEVAASTENEHKLGGNMNFKSKGAYQNWLGYVHATGVAENTPGNQPVSIKGKTHNVQHAMGGNMYANGGPFNNKGFRSLPTNVQNKIKSNSFADGGSMGQLTEFNEGGTHEESPLGGIPQGTAPDGKVNLVEEGETKLNSENYVFSDTLKIDRDTMATFAIPKTDVGKTFAEVSKKANRPNSRRENDTIEQVAIKRDLDNLMNAQEAFKAKEVQKKLEEIQSLDPNALAQVAQSYQPQGMPQQEGAPQGMEEMPQGQPSQEEMMMAQGQPQEEQMDPAMMQQMMAQQGGQPMAYGGPMSYKCGGNMYDFGGWADTNSGTISGAGTGALSGASTGATIGSVVPGIGTAVGAVVGGLVGGVTGGLSGRKKDEAERLAQQEASNAAKQQTPEMQLQRMQDPNYMMPNGQYNLNAGGGPGFANGGHLYPTNYPTYMDNAGAMGQPLTNLYEEGGNQYGGDLDSPTEDDMIARLEQEESDIATRSFEGGGTFNVQDRDMFGSIRPSNIDYTQYNSELANPFNKEAVDARRAEGLIPKDAKFGENTMTKEELAKYLSDLQAADETLKDKNPDLNMNQTLGQAAGLALPAAYNISQGLFGKVGKLNPEDYYQKADFTPYEYNIDPQKAQANITFAQAQAAARNAAPGAGAYLSNMQQAGLMRNDAYAKLYAEKQNIDAANALDAKVRNKAIEAANKGVLSNVTDYNIKAKEAKRQMLAAGLKQGADIAKGASEMDAQAAYMKLLAPDYAGTFNYNTIFDQLAAKRKEAKTNANNKTV